MVCLKVKEYKLKCVKDMHDDPDSLSWTEWMEVLVTEFCCLCTWKSLVDRIIELPWNLHEEKYLHGCLLHSATDDPSSAALLVVFHLQCFRHYKGDQVDLTLRKWKRLLNRKHSQ